MHLNPSQGIHLAHKLRPNPLHCLTCNGEIAPGSTPISAAVVDALASWNAAFGALNTLWLDSGEYEEWAKERLLDPSGQVNVDGLNISVASCCPFLRITCGFIQHTKSVPGNAHAAGHRFHPLPGVSDWLATPVTLSYDSSLPTSQ